jgi:hypothetical protein
VTVTEGSETSLCLTVEAYPTPSIEWFKNGARMKPDKRFNSKFEENTFYLTLSEAKSADQCKYKAVLKNKAGTIESVEVDLIVTG